jgi:ribosome-associated protein
MIRITDDIAIADDEIAETFLRASGPGGQHVNKTSTAVQLRFDVRNSPSLPGEVKARLAALAGRRLTQDGVLVLTARAWRSQERNRAAALAALIGLVRQAAIPPTPRRPTKPSKASRLRRLQEKSHRATTKRARARPERD